MKAVQENKIKTETIWYSYLSLITGGSSTFALNYLSMFTIIHEFLHIVPLFIAGVPFFISEIFCTSSYVIGLFRGVAWLSCVFPYLVGYIVTFTPMTYMIIRRKLSLFWFEFVTVSFVLTLLCHVIHLWAEFLIIPV
ncbi:MAG: hypothetical protein ACUVXA_12450 [Candidatus Jordarchaeum sp.]|uniref:hypothetical protein n=1 Tax=Candidatus Jordarchaeum sp. TaxID=2823881 RepID=UPI004049F910